MCDNTCYSVSSVGTREQIACILKCELVPYPTPLCHQHYHYVYDTLQSKATRCCTCNATLRNARKRVCPDSETIQHWKRACWVLDLWKQAESNTITPKPLTDYGWMVVEGKLSVEWDSPSNMDEVQERVAGLLKGCGCKTGCQTRQCGCRAKGKACGEGCNCLNCTNTGPQAMSQYTSNTEFASLEEIMEESIPEDMDELMGWVFGENADTVTEQNEETEDDD